MYFRKDGKVISENEIDNIEHFTFNYKKSCGCNLPVITLSFIIILLVIMPIFSKDYSNFITQNNTCIACYAIILFTLIIVMITL